MFQQSTFKKFKQKYFGDTTYFQMLVPIKEFFNNLLKHLPSIKCSRLKSLSAYSIQFGLKFLMISIIGNKRMDQL